MSDRDEYDEDEIDHSAYETAAVKLTPEEKKIRELQNQVEHWRNKAGEQAALVAELETERDAARRDAMRQTERLNRFRMRMYHLRQLMEMEGGDA